MRPLALFAVALFVSASLAPAEEIKTKESPLGDWGTVVHPVEMAVGTKYEVVVKLKEAKEGQKVSVGLNSMIDRKFGGTNSVARPNNVDAVVGDLKFSITPKEKAGQTKFVLTVYLSPDGKWASKTASATAGVELAKPAAAPEAPKAPEAPLPPDVNVP